MEAVTPLTVSLDGVLLFIGDTNIFPMLGFENILATAAKEIEHMASTEAEDASKNTGENLPGINQDELSTRTTAGLDADGFVRVCIHLLRDNFLVKEMGFQHRVEALTVEQRDKEWAQRLPGTTVDDSADRAILNQIADMVVDLAALVPQSTTASPAAPGDVSVGGGGTTLPQPGADQTLLLGGEGKKAEQADWKGQVTAREVAKKAKAQQLRISNTVVRILGQIHPDNVPSRPPTQRPDTSGASAEDRVEVDGTKEDENEVASSSSSDTSSNTDSTDRPSRPPAPTVTPDDFTTLASDHPSQQLLKAGKELMRQKRPEQAVVVWGQAAEILRNTIEDSSKPATTSDCRGQARVGFDQRERLRACSGGIRTHEQAFTWGTR
ncbi:hypothetical protein Esi_0618_0005 [Ectocarpus siliculosus]|uniref:Uncharacterized protein n=1 Tax=Ectocarpus siliculosus TaxID=2880 RepID=D7G540_ECTSI|nr:hypothetical protein Esi_0618_0005 [Ectocarpus siliculosus]|eukprot:CBJ33803.1 hypothetical protein Esi_0618_0005 [Ectocarpus siliculosus]